MNFVKSIVLFLKNIFGKKNHVKMLEENKQDLQNEKKIKFMNQIKINKPEQRKNNIETLTCFGDGLGIQTKINY